LEVNVKFTLRTGNEAPERETEVQMYSFFNLGARWEWVTVSPTGRRPDIYIIAGEPNNY